MDAKTLQHNHARLLERVRLAAEKYQRQPESIRILAVSKTRNADEVRLAAELGLQAFGENYLQEAREKIAQLADLDLEWHFIGPIQSNKTRAIAEDFDWVHSVDREKVARRLSEQRPAGLPPLQICLQVNVSAEASKAGVSPDALPALVEAVLAMPRLQLRGLMAIPEATEDTAAQRRAFASLRHCLEQLRSLAPGLDTLSMGMSGDLESAIAEGATIVRIGTDLFGPRPQRSQP